MKLRILTRSAALALLLAAPSIGHAQMFNSIGGKAPPVAPALPPPPGLPGATTKHSDAAPSDRPAADMEPTDALFDSINRGDIAAARDAISRGADLHARNVLGMSPIELSVDLGRNDISFMLLSMRGAEDTRTRQAATDTTAKPASTKQAKQVSTRPPSTPAAKHVAASAQQPAPSQTARLFSGDGGTPIPSAGFLGFDSARR